MIWAERALADQGLGVCARDDFHAGRRCEVVRTNEQDIWRQNYGKPFGLGQRSDGDNQETWDLERSFTGPGYLFRVEGLVRSTTSFLAAQWDENSISERRIGAGARTACQRHKHVRWLTKDVSGSQAMTVATWIRSLLRRWFAFGPSISRKKNDRRGCQVIHDHQPDGAAASGTIGNNQKSWMEATVTGP